MLTLVIDIWGHVHSTLCMQLHCFHVASFLLTNRGPWMSKCSCAACLISLFPNKVVWISLCGIRHELIAVKSSTKKVAITHSASGPPQITVIPNRHFRQEPWLSQHGRWTCLKKIKCTYHELYCASKCESRISLLSSVYFVHLSTNLG